MRPVKKFNKVTLSRGIKEVFMKKLLYGSGVLLLFYLAQFFYLPTIVSATTPTISNVSGAIQTGQTLTITGTTMMDEDKTNWDTTGGVNLQSGPAYGFEGSSFTSDGYEFTSDGVDQNGVDCHCVSVGYSSSVKLSGNQSAHFHIDGQHTDTINHNPHASADIYYGPQNLTTVYVRGYTRYDGTGWPNGWFKHWWTLASPPAGGSSGSGSYLVMQPDASGPSLPTVFDYGDSYGGNVISIPSGTLERGRWYCLELEMQVVNGLVQLTPWIDGVQGTTYTTQNSPAIEMDWYEFGIINLNGTDSNFVVDNYVDNFALSKSTRIYCSSIIEIGNNPNYLTATKVYQQPLYLSDGSIQIKANLKGLGAGPYYLWVTNNKQERSAAYLLTPGKIPMSPSTLKVH